MRDAVNEERAIRPRRKIARRKEKKNTAEPIKENSKGKIDTLFLTLTFLLLIIGLIMMFSASHAASYSRYGDSFYYIKRQSVFAVLGVVIMFVVSRIDYKIFRKYSLLCLAAAIVLLMLVPIIGIRLGGAKRWISLGFTTFQPSEIAKLAVILSFSHIIAANYKNMKTFKVGILPFVLILGIIAGLLFLEPHFSATILICMTGAILMIIGGANMKFFAVAALIGAVGIGILIAFTDYASGRVTSWLDPFSDPSDKTFQIVQSLYAIGSGNLFGVGLGQSRQKFSYIPEPQNDFIFAIVCEELGFVGAMLILVIFALLVWRGFIIAMKAPDKFSSLVVIGITSSIAIQTILNICVVANIIPVTGIALPFFSYGGTALVMLLFEIGIVLSISRSSRVNKG